MNDKLKTITRPEIKEFFGEDATIEKVHKTYIDNPELFQYAQALDEYIDEITKL